MPEITDGDYVDDYPRFLGGDWANEPDKTGIIFLHDDDPIMDALNVREELNRMRLLMDIFPRFGWRW